MGIREAPRRGSSASLGIQRSPAGREAESEFGGTDRGWLAGKWENWGVLRVKLRS